MGKLDNTLIIYINGDNGTSSEGTLNGTPNEVAMFNGVEVSVEDQLRAAPKACSSPRVAASVATASTS